MKRKIVNFGRYFVFFLLMCLVILPLLYILIASFKTNEEIYNQPWGLPESFCLDGYLKIFTDYNIFRNLINSLWYALVTCIVVIFVSSTASYAITRMRWRGRKLVLNYLLLGIMVPIHSLLVPLYICSSRLPITNKDTLILIYIVNSLPTAVFLLTGYLESIPFEMEEAAVIDGASVPSCFARVIFPLLKPSIATISILTFMWVWNDLLMGLIFLTSDKQYTIQLFISQFKGTRSVNYPALLAAIVLATVPMITVYLLMSKKMIEGMTAGAVKG